MNTASVKIEFNDIKSLYKKNHSGWRRFVGLGYIIYFIYVVIINAIGSRLK